MTGQIKYLLGFFILLVSSQAFSLTLSRATTEELTNESAIVLHGRVKSVEYLWENENLRTINTFITVDVDEYIKGSDDYQIVVKQMGGQIGDIGDVISGTPSLEPGEEVVLFLVESNGSYEIHSIALGLFRVFIGQDNSKQVINDLRNVYLIDPVTRQIVQPEDALTSFPLNAFISEIKSYIKDQ